MTQKEIIEFSYSNCQTSKILQPVILEFLKNNPGILYTRVNYDKDIDLIKTIITSQPPTISPFFVGFVDGKISASISGMVDAKGLEKIIE